MAPESRPVEFNPGRASVAQIKRATKPPEHEFVLARYYGRIISPYLTWVCLRLGMTADQVTIAGGVIGALGAAIMFPALGPWTAVGVIALQLAYLLDFSDGQVARMRGTSSTAGGYLDWLTHLYVPPAAALATSASIAIAIGQPWPFALGIAAALELAPMAFQAKEHLLVAMARTDPALAGVGFLLRGAERRRTVRRRRARARRRRDGFPRAGHRRQGSTSLNAVPCRRDPHLPRGRALADLCGLRRPRVFRAGRPNLRGQARRPGRLDSCPGGPLASRHPAQLPGHQGGRGSVSRSAAPSAAPDRPPAV